MKKSLWLIAVLTLVLSACAPAAPAAEAPAAAAPAAAAPAAEVPAKAENPGLQMESAQVAPQFFIDADYTQSLELMKNVPLNPDDPIYLQYLLEDPTDITKYPEYASFAEKEPPYNLCFSNAGVNNPWRVVGYVDMREQVEELRTAGKVANFCHLDAQGNDAKQIADIQDLIDNPGKCDLLIVAPNTSDALTPIIEKACEAMPVVMFDRYAFTDCPVVSERPVGGYAFGISGAQFVVDNLPEGGNVLAFRILPGVDVLEQRWGAARKIFEQNPQREMVRNLRLLIVLDRDLSIGMGGIVYSEFAGSLYSLSSRPTLINYIVGLGGRAISLADIKALTWDALERAKEGETGVPCHWVGVRGLT